ncbi:hypothetical protein AC629_27845 [Bradyrhizobium sp. NAS80.1]|nr:hypothetical protein AC629_27845 [Bradyrhizobium sp. NAS80.1]
MHRLIPPATGTKITANGRTYDPTAGAQDVPDFDANVLQANGWSFVAVSGPTATRHSATTGAYPLHAGVKYWDTTISHLLTWDGKNWRNEAGVVA